MLYSIGKDSAVMLHLAMKAFYPSKPPFPLLHVDTTWKFKEMIAFRDQRAKELGVELLVHINPQGIEMGINPFKHGSKLHTEIMKTAGLEAGARQHGASTRRSVARGATRKNRAPRNACCPSAPRSIDGTPRTSARNSGGSTTRAGSGRKPARFSAVQLDRGRCVGLYRCAKTFPSCRSISPSRVPWSTRRLVDYASTMTA